MKTIVQWKEKYKNKAGDELTRSRKYDWDEENREFVDYEDYVPTLRIPVRLLADKDMASTKSHEARVIINFAKKEATDGDINTEFRAY